MGAPSKERRLTKYIEVVKEFLLAKQKFYESKTPEREKEYKRARQRHARRRAILSSDGIDDKEVDVAFVMAATELANTTNKHTNTL